MILFSKAWWRKVEYVTDIPISDWHQFHNASHLECSYASQQAGDKTRHQLVRLQSSSVQSCNPEWPLLPLGNPPDTLWPSDSREGPRYLPCPPTSSQYPLFSSPSNSSSVRVRMAVSKIRQNYHEDCEALINKQINMEFYASYVYLSMVSTHLSLNHHNCILYLFISL